MVDSRIETPGSEVAGSTLRPLSRIHPLPRWLMHPLCLEVFLLLAADLSDLTEMIQYQAAQSFAAALSDLVG